MHGKIFLNRAGCLQFLVIFSFLISSSLGQMTSTTPRTQPSTTTSRATPTIATTTSTSSRTSPPASTTVRSGVTIATTIPTQGTTSPAASTTPSTIRSTSANATTSPLSSRTTAASLTTISLSTTRPPATNATTSSVTSRTSVTSSILASLLTTLSTINATTPTSANRTTTAINISVSTSTARSTGSNFTTLSPQNRTSTILANSMLPSTITTIATAATGPSSTTLRSASVTASNQANFSTTTSTRTPSSPTSNSTTTRPSSFATLSSGNSSSSPASLTTSKTIQSTNTSLASTVAPLATASSTSFTPRTSSSAANSGTTTSNIIPTVTKTKIPIPNLLITTTPEPLPTPGTTVPNSEAPELPISTTSVANTSPNTDIPSLPAVVYSTQISESAGGELLVSVPLLVLEETSSMPITTAADSTSPLVPHLTATNQVTISTVSDAAVLALEIVPSTETSTSIAPELISSTAPETTSSRLSLLDAAMDSSYFTTKVSSLLSEAPSLEITRLSASEQTVDHSTTISNSNGASGLIERATTTNMIATNDTTTESDASASKSEMTEESDDTSEFTDVTDTSTFETDSTDEGHPVIAGMSDDELVAFETDLVQTIIPVTKDVTDALEVFNGIFVGEIIPLDGVVSNVTGKKLEETIRKWRLFRSFLDTLGSDSTSSGETVLAKGITFTPEDGKLYELSNFVTQTSHEPEFELGTWKSAWTVINDFLVSWKHLHLLTMAANEIIEDKVAEMKKAITKATEKLEAMNTLQAIYVYQERLVETERDMSVKNSLHFIKLKELHREIQQMKNYDKEVKTIYNTMLALQTRGDNQEKKQEDNANSDEKHQLLHSILESKQHAFFAQRTSSCSLRDTLSNYEINNLNQGGGFNKTSGIFTVPVNGIYYFYFSALKTKQGGCGTSRLSIQIVQTSPTSRVLAGIQMDSSDWFGWFPLQLQAPVNLVVNDQIGVKLSEGCIYGNGSVDHLTTNFGGFVIASL